MEEKERTHRPRAAFVALAAVTAALAVVGPAPAQAPEPPTIVVQNGLTQPVFSFANAIEQRVWIQTEVDTDGDGALDRVLADVSRPRETETQGFKVPVVFEHSPYRQETWGAVPYYEDLNPDVLPQSVFRHRSDEPHGVPLLDPLLDLPGTLDNYYVPRGYAVVLGRSVGTGGLANVPDGCPTTGDEAETLGTKAIIDWLNGRAPAWDASGNPVVADWTTGDVGMIGASYNGTLPNQVATTGVEGLKTIVPIVSISDWYGYYRENGLVVAPGGFQGEDADVLAGFTAGQARATGKCAEEIAAIAAAQDRVSGDYNAFWAARNYLPGAKHVKASVFVVDGRNDWNVKPLQWGRWWDELSHYKIPRKIWLHNGGHGTPGNNASYTLPNGTVWTYQTTVHRWFDHWLWNVDNGIMDEPRAIVQRENSANQTYSDWPDEAVQQVPVRLTASAAGVLGGLTAAGVVAPKQAAQSFVDNGRNVTATTLISNPDVVSPNRLVYLSGVLTEPLRLSGTPRLRLRASVDNASAANLTAYLVDYGPPGSTSRIMVTRGWMDVQNRIRRDRTDPIQQGQTYDFEWDLHPDDYVFQAGRRVGLVVFSTDWDFTLRPAPGTQLTVQPGFSLLTLPLVGGASF